MIIPAAEQSFFFFLIMAVLQIPDNTHDMFASASTLSFGGHTRFSNVLLRHAHHLGFLVGLCVRKYMFRYIVAL